MSTATIRQTLPLLTADEERELGMLIRAGDQAAFDRLVLSNLRLVTNYVGKLEWPGGMQRADLEQHGILGLMRAARDFDPANHDNRFSTYAMWWIRQSVLRALKREGGPIRVPEYLFNAARNVSKGREVPENIRELVARYQAIAVFSTGDGDGVNDVASPPDDAGAAEEAEGLAVALAGLGDRERYVIEARFWRGESLAVVGEVLGVTKERVRQIEALALKRLRRKMGVRGVEV